MKRVAALDLGTNSFLCLIAEGDRTGIKKILSDNLKIVRLGENINQTQVFTAAALQRADDCLTEFKKIIDKFQVDEVLAMATSAARDALNQEEFFYICKKHNIPTRIISGQDEARITFQGTTALIDSKKADSRKKLVIDIGGGSTELILGKETDILYSQSLNIGGVRLTETEITSQPVSEEEQNRLIKRIEGELKTAIREIKKQGVDVVIAVAGTPTALAAAEIGQFEVEKIDGYQFSIDKINKWVERLKTSSVQDKIDKLKIAPGRADIIYVGAVILATIIKNLNLTSLEVSTKGVRYGIALELFKRE